MTLFELLGTIAIDNSKANKALDDTSEKGKSASSKMGSAFKKIGHGAAVVGKAVGTGMIAAGAAMGGLTIKALNMSGELEQNMGGSEKVFGKYAGRMQDTAKDAFSNMGLSTNDYLATANKMGSLFQGAGFSVEESMTRTQDAMQRAADVASIMGIDTEAAMEAVAGAAKGNFTMMDNLGVAMNDTTLQAYAMSKGIKKSTSEMTQQEKIGLAMDMFLEKTTYAMGNYADENDTLAGSLGTAKAALTNFLDGSGDVDQLVDAFTHAAVVITDNISELAPRLISGMTEILNQIIPIIPPLLGNLLPVIIEGAVSLINGLVAAAPAILTMLLNMLPAIIDGFMSIIDALIAALPTLVESLCAALPTLIPQLVTALVDLIVLLCTMLPQIIQPIIDYLPEIIVSLVNALLENLPALLEGIGQLIVGICEALPEILAAIGEAIDTLIAQWLPVLLEWAAPLVETISTWWSKVKTSATTWWTNIKTAVSEKFTALKDGLVETVTGIYYQLIIWWLLLKSYAVETWENLKTSVAEKFTNLKTSLVETVTAIWTSVTTWFNLMKTSVVNKATEIWTSVKTKFTNLKNSVTTTVTNLWTSVTEKFTSAKTAVVDTVTGLWYSITSKFTSLKTSISTVWTNIKKAIKTPIEDARDLVETAIEKIKGFFDFEIEWPDIPLPHFSVTPAGWEFGDLLKGSVPKLGIEWYAKAMNNPLLLNEPSIFGYDAASGNLLGGGESGAEVVAGASTLMGMIRSAVAANNGAIADKIVPILVAILNAITDGNEDLIGAVLSDKKFVINNREFARAVKAYA